MSDDMTQNDGAAAGRGLPGDPRRADAMLADPAPADPMRVNPMLAKTPMDARIASMIEPVVRDMGFDLVRVRLTGARRPVLQIMAERPDGAIDVDDCAEISRVVSALLDVEDPIDKEYVLEVSSPGVDRPLTRPADFARYAGFEAKIELADPVDGRKRFRGRLAGHDPQTGDVRLDNDEIGSLRFAFSALADAKLVLTDELIAASLKGEAVRTAADGAQIEIGAEAAAAEPPTEDDDDGRQAGDDAGRQPSPPRRPSAAPGAESE